MEDDNTSNDLLSQGQFLINRLKELESTVAKMKVQNDNLEVQISQNLRQQQENEGIKVKEVIGKEEVRAQLQPPTLIEGLSLSQTP